MIEFDCFEALADRARDLALWIILINRMLQQSKMELLRQITYQTGSFPSLKVYIFLVNQVIMMNFPLLI
jgi:hypothetical protein